MQKRVEEGPPAGGLKPEEIAAACDRLHLFPLPSTVFFPSTVVPLHVFEPRYRDLVRDCLDTTRCMAIPLLKPGYEAEYDNRPPIHPVAGMGAVVHHEEMRDGRFLVVLDGVARVRILEEHPPNEPFRLGRCDLMDLPHIGEPAVVNRSLEQLRLLFGQYLLAHPDIAGERDEAGELLPGAVASPEIDRLMAGRTNPRVYVHLVGHLVLQDPQVRQKFLEAERVIDQMDMAISAVTEELHTPFEA